MDTRDFGSGTLASPSLGISATRTASIVSQVLFLPGGIPSLFVSGSTGDQNPCVEAVKKAKEHASGTQTTSGGQAAKNESETKEKEGLGTKIKNLFSKPKE